MFLFCFSFLFSELGTEPRALRLLGKSSTTELNPQPPKHYVLKINFGYQPTHCH
ncbi:rCG42616 [Rattus norvegicus]|uniref:RCG42616 n=1 Tax=Rattus norvegicus TaxID=10116 RepID=A6K1P1_RAT|nr:rCG42616 [Rattus norvegicus]